MYGFNALCTAADTGEPSQFIFANTNRGRYSKMMTLFQNAWRKFGIPGKTSFSLIRKM